VRELYLGHVWRFANVSFIFDRSASYGQLFFALYAFKPEPREIALPSLPPPGDELGAASAARPHPLRGLPRGAICSIERAHVRDLPYGCGIGQAAGQAVSSSEELQREVRSRPAQDGGLLYLS
jgi:hypothetical protein